MVMKLVFQIVLISLLALQARAELVIEITQGNQRAIPVAVVPFQWKGLSALPENVAQIVANDLGRSGYFNSLPKTQMLSLPNTEEEIFYRDWEL